MTVLRDDLLTGMSIAIAGADGELLSGALVSHGANVEPLEMTLEDEEAAEQWATVRAPLRALVFDSRPAFGSGGADSLRAVLEHCWGAVRALAAGALIPAAERTKIVLIAPSPDAGAHAEAARAGLENLARTLSVEWARHQVTTTAVMPGERTTDEQIAELVAFLVSAAGDYLSGCRLDLGSLLPGDPR